MSTIGIPNFNNLLSERDKIRAIQWLFSKIANIESTTSGGYTPPTSGIPADKLVYEEITPGSSVALVLGKDYYVSSAIATFAFTLANNPSNGELSVIFTTGASPAITITSNATIYTQEGFSIDANSTYEMNIKALNGSYYIVLVKMEAV